MLIVADDLTGAADSAGAFAAAGLSAVVVLSESGAGASGEATNAGIVSIDTNGRNLDEDDAFLATATAVSAAAHRPVFVKIDSTLRGHVRSTVLAVLSALQTPPKRVVVCPAFPALGRTVIDAEVHVDGVPIEGGNLRDVLRGFPAGAGLFIPAVRTDEDLAAVVHRMHDHDHPADTLWVGSAGLAHHLAPHQRQLTASAHMGVTVARSAATRIAVVVGSQHEQTLAQLAALDIAAQTATNSQVFRIDPHDQGFIAQILPTLLKADALVLTGGHTARVVLDALGVQQFTVGGEIMIGMPWSTAVVGIGDGSHPISIVTKAGGFGDDLALRRAAEFLYNP